MAKVIFFNIPAQGHINPSLPLVRELVARGETVIYYNTEAARTRVEATGANFRAYEWQDDFEPEANVAGPIKAMALILGLGERMLDSLLAVVRHEQPDYILYDSMAPWGKQIAQILDLPAICSCAIMFIGSSNLRAMPRLRVDITELLSGALPVVGALWRYRQTAKRIRHRHKVGSPTLIDFFGNPGDMTIVYTSRYFQIGADYLDDHFKFVGPSIAPRHDMADFPIGHLSRGPVIYVSLGTLFNEHLDFFRLCIATFADTPYQVVISIGNRVSAEMLGPIPENVLVRSYVPQLDVLARTDLFLTHGGMNSVSESAWYGVPMLVLPQAGDQLMIAKQVERLGAGLCLEDKKLAPDYLRLHVERVLNTPSFRQESQRIGDSLRAAGGYSRAADEIQSFMARTQHRKGVSV
jgi:MGT family glycosyltransferase